MPKKYALIVGLDCGGTAMSSFVDTHCHTCVADALMMNQIAQECGFEQSLLLLNENATVSKVKKAIITLGENANAGDLILISFSGHGVQTKDRNGDEADGKEESWLLFDKLMNDNVIHSLLTRFKPGVQVFIFIDCCFSGGIINENNTTDPKLRASFHIFSSCQEGEEAKLGRRYSLFTKTLYEVWDNGQFLGTLLDFFQTIYQRIPSNLQKPKYQRIGPMDNRSKNKLPFSTANLTLKR